MTPHTDAAGILPPAYTPATPRGVTPHGRLRETLEVVEQGWTRRMIRVDHPVYSARIGWERNWTEPGVAADANVLGLYVARGLGKLAWLLPDSDSARYFRGTVLPRLLVSQDSDGYMGARANDGAFRYPCWELMAEADLLETLMFEYRLTSDADVGEAIRRLSGFLVTDAAYMGGDGYPSMPSLSSSPRWDCEGALFRGMLQTACALTGDARIPTRLRGCYEHIREAIRTQLETSGTDENWAGGHMVHISHSIQAPSVMSLLTGNPADLALAIRGAERIMEIAEQVSGYPVGWEAYEARDPRKTTEHCNFIEWPTACRTLFSLTGQVRFADWAERSLYNGYWGSKTKDGVALQYQSAPNQLVLAPWMRTQRDRDAYGVNHGWFDMQHGPGCCNAFSAEAFPRHIEHAVARGRNGAVAVVYYMPCRFSIPLDDGNPLTLTMDTDYPFEDAVRLKLQLAAPARFALELRIPTWARGATVAVNGVPVDLPVCPGTLCGVERDWRSGDIVELAFDFPVQLARHDEAGCVPGVAVQRGPLVFALPVEARREYAGVGQPGPEAIAERWHLFPAEGACWNVALDLDPDNPESACRLVRLAAPGGTRAWQSAPIGLCVRGCRVPAWKLAGTPGQPATPPMPARGDFAGENPALNLLLVPMGCTELRMTCLPLMGKQDGDEGQRFQPSLGSYGLARRVKTKAKIKVKTKVKTKGKIKGKMKGKNTMTPRANLMAALDGRRPDRIPYTVNREFVTADPAWESLFAAGLCPIPYVHTVREERIEVECLTTPIAWRGQSARRVTLRTPAGEISQVELDGWVQEYFLKTPADYRVMEYIVRHTRLTLDPAAFEAAERAVGERGLTLVGVGRSPMQTILVDYAGLENFSYHLADAFPELFALAEALADQLEERCRLTAAGPGRMVSLLENFTAETWGVARFARYHLPVYAKILPLFQTAGKRVFPHCDGQLACVARLLADTGFAGIESLTEPPEGDLTLAQARAAMPNKIFWTNINIGLYALPSDELRRWVRQRVQAAAPEGRSLAFEISEDLPPNWREAIPVVLETLREEADE